jgi:hypothetical protein
MTVNPDQLHQHYASLSDEALLAIDPNDLTEIAQKYYAGEIERRGLALPQSESSDDVNSAMEEWEEDETGVEGDDDEPFIACAFSEIPNGSSAADAEDAYRALKKAGIPCRIEVHAIETETGNNEQQTERQVIVPAAYSLHATSVLDRDLFNPRVVSDWKTHLQSLTDDQFLRLNVDDMCAGLLDRAARLKGAYMEERRRRNLHSVGSAGMD